MRVDNTIFSTEEYVIGLRSMLCNRRSHISTQQDILDYINQNAKFFTKSIPKTFRCISLSNLRFTGSVHANWKTLTGTLMLTSGYDLYDNDPLVEYILDNLSMNAKRMEIYHQPWFMTFGHTSSMHKLQITLHQEDWPGLYNNIWQLDNETEFDIVIDKLSRKQSDINYLEPKDDFYA